MEDKEIWKEIDEFQDYYISNWGRIKSPRKKIMNPTKITTGGQLYASLKACFHPMVSRLVASAFIANPDNMPYVIHIDGNLKNNKVENLQWSWASDSMRSKKKRVAQYSKDGKLLNTFDSVMAAAHATGINRSSLYSAVSGRTRTSGGYIWQKMY